MLNITQIYSLTNNETIINWTLNTTNILQAQIQTEQNWQTAFIITTLLCLLAALFIYWNAHAKQRINEKYTIKNNELRELVNTLKNEANKEGFTTKRIYIDDLPQDLKEELTDKTNKLGQIFSQAAKEDRPLLFLLKEDDTVEIKKNVKPGHMIVESKDPVDQKPIKKMLFIKQNKLKTIIWGNLKIKCWIHYENEVESYPLEEKHASEGMYRIVEKIELNEGRLAPQGGKFPKIIIVIGILLIIGAIVYFAFFNKGAGAAQALETANTTINATLNNTMNTTIRVVNLG